VNRKALERHNEEQQAYFAARVPRTMIPVTTPYVRRHVDELLRGSGLGSGDSVLEVGCGMGHYTFELASRGLALEGLDLSAVLLDRLRAYATEEDVSIPLHCADIAEAGAELAGRFDGVIGLFTLHHLHDLGASLASMAPMLRPGGRIAFVEPNPFNPLYYVQIAGTPGMSWRHERGLLRLRPAVLRRAVAAAGLASFELRRYGFLPPFAANRASARAVERTLERIGALRPVSAFQLILARRA